MMEIVVTRRWKKLSYTIGEMSIDGKKFCNTLEDIDRGLSQSMTEQQILSVKVKGQTAIPTGRYKVVLSWSPRFAKILPLVENVKGFTGIRIHSGNTAKDTDGCILVGENKAVGQVLNSRATMNKLMALLDNTKEEIWITIK